MEQDYAFPFAIDEADPLEPRKPERRIVGSASGSMVSSGVKTTNAYIIRYFKRSDLPAIATGDGRTAVRLVAGTRFS